MKRVPTLFLKIAVVAVGLAVLAICMFALPAMWVHIPQEYPGVANALYGIFIAIYIAALPFFVGLYQALHLLHFIDANKAFSDASVQALQRIAYCAVVVSILYAATLPCFYIWAQYDDAPGLVVIGMVLTIAPFTVGVFAAVLQQLLRQVIRIKSENDLTV